MLYSPSESIRLHAEPTGLFDGILERLFPGVNSAVTIEFEVQLDQLESVYLIHDASAVRRFLRNNSNLLPLLWDAIPRVAKYFEDYTLMSLEVVTDPEGGDWEQLFVNIRTSMSIEDGFDRLEEMIEKWQDTPNIDLQESDNLLIFDLEFV